MPAITAAQVKELRDATNVSMMECKRALQETDGDVPAAMKLLRERGMAVATKRASKEAKQGIIAAATNEDGRRKALVEVNCETDFVARNDDFREFVNEVAEQALISDAPLAETMHDTLMEKIAAIGENIKIRRHDRFELQGAGRIEHYIHMGGKVGVLVEIACEKPETVQAPAFRELAHDIALHIAASAPRYLVAEEVPEEEVEAEREIFAKQVADKPAAVIDKIIEGKLRKFYSEICLLDQPFVKEPKQRVRQTIDAVAKNLGDTIRLRRFVRYQLGQ